MDHGSPPLNSSTLHVNITVADENDNNPKFEQAMYRVEVWENETIGGHVVQVKATERDSATGSRIGYNISAGDPHGQFKIFYTSVRWFSFLLSLQQLTNIFIVRNSDRKNWLFFKCLGGFFRLESLRLWMKWTRGDSYMKRLGTLVVSIRAINQEYWNNLGCWWRNASIFSFQSIF